MSSCTPSVTFKGNPVTIVGPQPCVGSPAPNFTAVDTGLQPVSLSDFLGKTVLISVVPSVDTGVCELQTQRFDREAASLNAVVLTISVDLPFAHKRFCGAHNTNAGKLLSDYRDREFAKAYGVLIDELRLLTRAVFVVDPKGILVYKEIVSEVTNHPNYDAAIAAARKAG